MRITGGNGGGSNAGSGSSGSMAGGARSLGTSGTGTSDSSAQGGAAGVGSVAAGSSAGNAGATSPVEQVPAADSLDRAQDAATFDPTAPGMSPATAEQLRAEREEGGSGVILATSGRTRERAAAQVQEDRMQAARDAETARRGGGSTAQ